MQDLVPDPAVALSKLNDSGLLENVIELTGSFVNTAFGLAVEDAQQNNRVFSPQNWSKASSPSRRTRWTC